MGQSWQELEAVLVLYEFTGHNSQVFPLPEFIKDPAGQTVKKKIFLDPLQSPPPPQQLGLDFQDGFANSKGGVPTYQFGHFYSENCKKLKKLDQEGAHAPSAPYLLDPPMKVGESEKNNVCNWKTKLTTGVH